MILIVILAVLFWKTAVKVLIMGAILLVLVEAFAAVQKGLHLMGRSVSTRGQPGAHLACRSHDAPAAPLGALAANSYGIAMGIVFPWRPLSTRLAGS